MLVIQEIDAVKLTAMSFHYAVKLFLSQKTVANATKIKKA